MPPSVTSVSALFVTSRRKNVQAGTMRVMQATILTVLQVMVAWMLASGRIDEPLSRTEDNLQPMPCPLRPIPSILVRKLPRKAFKVLVPSNQMMPLPRKVAFSLNVASVDGTIASRIGTLRTFQCPHTCGNIGTIHSELETGVIAVDASPARRTLARFSPDRILVHPVTSSWASE